MNIELLSPITQQLLKYGLIWDLQDTAISTFCKSKKIAREVAGIISNAGIKCHQMNIDNRILVIYND